MNLLCVSNKSNFFSKKKYPLTIGKIYNFTAIDISSYEIKITNDNGYDNFYPQKLFKLVEISEIRNKKLTQLGI